MEKIVNEIATLKAQIAELSKDLKAKESVLKEIGSGEYKGSEHYIVISEATRKTLDMKAVRAKLSRQFIQANTNETDYLTVKIYGYGKKIAA